MKELTPKELDQIKEKYNLVAGPKNGFKFVKLPVDVHIFTTIKLEPGMTVETISQINIKPSRKSGAVNANSITGKKEVAK